MIIHSAKFLAGITIEHPKSLENYPHFAVIGRSNVGKSSFINSVTQQKDLAYTGARPGVTQQVNLFLLNKKIYLSDMPGYGYARLSYHQRLDLEALITWYLDVENDEENPRVFTKVFHLVDAEVGPTKLDLTMRDFLAKQPFQTIVVANKIDKLKSSQRTKALGNIETCFHGLQIIPYSSKTGEGKKDILREIFPQ